MIFLNAATSSGTKIATWTCEIRQFPQKGMAYDAYVHCLFLEKLVTNLHIRN